MRIGARGKPVEQLIAGERVDQQETANGEWKKGGFRKAVNAAHKVAKAGKK